MKAHPPFPSAWQLFRIWASIGLQSFGGGASTVLLIQRAFIDKYGWMTMEEFTHSWNLCIFTPGINLVALTVLIGRKLGGAWGIVASLAGMLLPSSLVTCLIAAGFKLIQNLPTVQAIVHGVIPASGGIMLVVGLRFAQPLIKLARKEGWLRLVMSAIIILLCASTIIIFKISVIPVLLAMALLGMLFFTSWRTPSEIATSREIAEEEGHD
jgi:chromate transporter